MFSNSTTVRRLTSEYRSWPLNVHKPAAARKKFAALLRDCFHGGGNKLFKEGLLVHYVDFDHNISARLDLRVKGLDRHSPDSDADERGNCHRVFPFSSVDPPRVTNQIKHRYSIISSAIASSVYGRDQGSSQATDQECAARRPEPARMRPCRPRHRLHAHAPSLA